MRTVTFKSVLYLAADIGGLDPEQLTAAEQRRVTRKINNRLEKAWAFDRWPELVPVELRAFRDRYSDDTAYSAPNATTPSETYFPATGRYYQALRATTGVPPEVLSGTDYVLNADTWALAEPSYSGELWQDGTAYAVGDTVRNPADWRFWRCHTAHTSAGALDDAFFGILTPFEPYVALAQPGETEIGEVLRLCQRDPRIYPQNPGVVRHRMGSKGAIPVGAPLTEVFVEFRRRRPVFDPTAWDENVDYIGDEVRYLASTGECYLALDATSGDDPSDSPAVWRKLDFPQVLADFTARAAGSDLLRDDGQNQKAAAEENEAYAKLAEARDIELEGQAQSESVQVDGY